MNAVYRVLIYFFFDTPVSVQGLAKSLPPVISADVGIQNYLKSLDSGVLRNDKKSESGLLQMHQCLNKKPWPGHNTTDEKFRWQAHVPAGDNTKFEVSKMKF